MRYHTAKTLFLELIYVNTVSLFYSCREALHYGCSIKYYAVTKQRPQTVVYLEYKELYITAAIAAQRSMQLISGTVPPTLRTQLFQNLRRKHVSNILEQKKKNCPIFHIPRPTTRQGKKLGCHAFPACERLVHCFYD